jgi:23S rRNA pseudouridine955/2504/2580 synthase
LEIQDKVTKITIDYYDANQRLDKFLMKLFVAPSFIYKMIRKNKIKLNNKPTSCNTIINAGDVICIFASREFLYKIRHVEKKNKSNKHLNVLYEDNDILICSKPVGILSQPDINNNNDTIVNRIYGYLGNYNAAICNRLDRNTSGIILCGKNFRAIQTINKMIQENLIEKFYLTIVVGKINQDARITACAMKSKKNNYLHVDLENKVDHNVKLISTEYQVLMSNTNFTLLRIKLITGRSHQIRAHMKSINHPIIGDQKYGDKKCNSLFYKKFGLQYQMLHAYKVKFNVGKYVDLQIEDNPPKKFLEVLNFCFGTKFKTYSDFRFSFH